MSRTGSAAAVAVSTVVAAALVVASTMGSLGSVIAFGGGGLVVLGAALGRLRFALVPLTIAGGLAAVAVMVPSPDDIENWVPAAAMLLLVLGVGGSLCVALGALIRRLGRPAAGEEGLE